MLHGPPGNGKSSLIAAMENYLKFDIYDLELTVIRHRKLLANWSILVVEDIDCTIELHDRLVSASPKNNQEPHQEEENKVCLQVLGYFNFSFNIL